MEGRQTAAYDGAVNAEYSYQGLSHLSDGGNGAGHNPAGYNPVHKDETHAHEQQHEQLQDDQHHVQHNVHGQHHQRQHQQQDNGDTHAHAIDYGPPQSNPSFRSEQGDANLQVSRSSNLDL